jgi:hypothetical protein
MHLIRRAAFRAASSHTAFSSRSITTSTPFVLRSKTQSAFTPSVFRRFNSDEASAEKSSAESANGEHGSVKSAIDSATESASTYASEAADKASDFADVASETVSETFEKAKDSIVDGAEAVGAYAGKNGYTPRERRPEREGYGSRDRQNRQPYDRNGGGRGGYGGDRVGYGGDRGMQRGDRDFSAPERKLTPTPGIYIGNLLFDVTAADLEREFQQFGKITSAVVATDARGLSKGFGYLEFETIDQATAAIEAKHQTVLEGRRLIVNYMNKTNRESRATNPPSKTLFIGNLAFEMSDADLNKLFRDIRNVIDVRVAIDRRTGQPRGFAHADFTDIDSAVKGKEALTGKEVYGRQLRVDFSAGSREARGDGGAPPSGGRGGRDSF